jgi:plastocyanin
VKKAAVAALLTVGLGTFAHRAEAATVDVTIQFQAFAPSSVDVLPGDVVRWTNHGGRTHTVTADGGQFDSGDLADGAPFSLTSTTLGAYRYHCTLHPRMTGEVNVRRVTFEPLASRLVVPNSTVALAGRTADPRRPGAHRTGQRGRIETVATVSPQADGGWSARVAATNSATLRAASGQDTSETRQLGSSRGRCGCNQRATASPSRSPRQLRIRESRFSSCSPTALDGGPSPTGGSTASRRQPSRSRVRCGLASYCWTGTAGPRSRSAEWYAYTGSRPPHRCGRGAGHRLAQPVQFPWNSILPQGLADRQPADATQAQRALSRPRSRRSQDCQITDRPKPSPPTSVHGLIQMCRPMPLPLSDLSAHRARRMQSVGSLPAVMRT